MKKSMKVIALTLTVLLCLPLLFSCGKTKKDDKVSRMTVDINPSVEFIVDSDNKVVTATALNDDGAIILAGEAFVGMTADEAAALVVSVANEQGYLVKGSAEVGNKEIKISVTGDEAAAKAIYDKAADKVDKFVKSHNLEAAVVKAEALNHEALARMAAHVTAGLEYEDALEMSDEELLRLIKLSRIETAELISAEMREKYYQFRDYKLCLAESEAVLEIIGVADEKYRQFVEEYRNAIKALENALEALNNVQEEYLFSEDSNYQKALKTVLEAKAEYQAKRVEAEGLADGTEKAAKLLALKHMEESLKLAEKALETYYAVANAAIEGAKSALEAAIAAMKEKEKDFPEEIKSTLTAKASEIDSKVNESKKTFCDEFEKAHKDDIEAYDKMIADLKEKYSKPAEETTAEAK